MITLLEGIRSLIRRNEGLDENLSSTEVKHYAAEILSRLRHGNTAEMLEPYLRQLRAPDSRHAHVSPAAHHLAGKVYALFHADISLHQALARAAGRSKFVTSR
jgi:hypothetical protein